MIDRAAEAMGKGDGSIHGLIVLDTDDLLLPP